jgi:ribosomal protein S18 acetylase RimI-like enzyme
VALQVRPLDEDERPWLEDQLARLWGSSTIVSRGRVYDGARLPALVCVGADDIVGLATYDVRDGECELLTLNAFTDGRGIGSALLDAVTEEARRRACSRLWLITTNDNLRALRFYQRRGLRLVAVHRDAIDEARRLKPSIPTVGDDGIPVHDEIELELALDANSA